MLLFVPIRYQAKAATEGGLKAEGSVTWLLRALNVTGGYEAGGFHFSVQLLGRVLLRRPTAKEQTPEPAEDEAEIRDEDEIPDIDGEIRNQMPDIDGEIRDEIQDIDGEIRDEIQDIDGNIRDEMTDIGERIQRDLPDMDSGMLPAGENRDDPRRPPFERLRGVFRFFRRILYAVRDSIRSIKRKIRRIRNSFQNLQKKLDRLKERADRWIRLWNAEQTGRARIHLWKNIRYLCRHYLPKTLEGRIRFGLEDPAATGQVLGILYLLSAFTGNRLEIEGEFQDQVLEGMFQLKGHIRACHLLIAALGLLADKNIRLTFRRVQRLRQGSLGENTGT